MSLLDEVINASSSRIVRQNHNLGGIKIERPDFDGDAERRINSISGGGWDASEYGISREAAVAAIKAADTPEAREKVMSDLRARAIRRAGLDVSNRRVSVMTVVGPNGEALPWHELGVMVASAVDSLTAEQMAGIGWKVLKVPAGYEWDGERKESASTFLLLRDDTGAQVGECGPKYEPIQNSEGFAFMDKILADFGARYETAGSIYGGRKVWMQAKLPKLIEVQAGDVVQGFATFILDHSGGGADPCFPTAERAVCANTLRLATGADAGKGIRIRHTGDIRSKVADAQRAMGLSVAAFESFGEAAAQMVRTPLDVNLYANEVLDAVLDLTQAQVAAGADVFAATLGKTQAQQELLAKTFAREAKRRERVLDDIMERYETDRCTPKGSVWAAFNSCTEAADHGSFRRYVGDGKLSRKFDSIVAGDADEMKQVAYVTATRALSV